MTNTPDPSEAMIEAGAKAFQRSAWQHPRANPKAAAEIIYRAMQSARTPTPSEDVVERVTSILRDYSGCSFDAQHVAQKIAASLTTKDRETDREALLKAIEIIERTPIGDIGSNRRPRPSWEEKRDEAHQVIAALKRIAEGMRG